LTLLGVLAVSAAHAAEWVWESESGWTDLSERPADSDSGLYAYGRGLRVRGDYAAAADVFADVERLFAGSPFAVKARFARAECAAKLGRFHVAVAIFKEFMAEPPPGFTPERAYTRVIEMLEPQIETDPHLILELLTPMLEDAPTVALEYRSIMAMADARVERREYELARLAYEAAADAVGQGEARFDALFEAARCDLIPCREIAEDEALLRRALERFRIVRNGTERKRLARAAQQYAWAIDNLLRDSDPAHRPLYYAVTYLPEERYEKALRPLKRARKKLRDTPAGETAHFYLAECLFLMGRRWKAFQVYELLFRDYPRTLRWTKIIDREFQIGRSLGRRRKFSAAITVLETVVRNDPRGRLADDAIMHVGELHLKDGRFTEAKATFALLASQYPESDWVNSAIFHSGLADLLHGDAGGDSEARLDAARAAFQVYLRNEPEGRFAARAQAHILECDERQARTMWQIVQFYERQKQPQAAAWYCGLAVQKYPEALSVKPAKSALSKYRRQGFKLP